MTKALCLQSFQKIMGTGFAFCLVLNAGGQKKTAWVQVSNATLNFGIIYQKKGVAYVPLLSVKY